MEDSPDTQPLFDITGLSPDDAKDYVLSLAVHLKRVEAEIAGIQGEQAVWQERAALAERQGLTALRQQALDTMTALAGKRAERETEAREFRAGLDHLKKQLLMLPLTQRTVNTDALLESLNQLAGPADNTSAALRKAEADEALAALKKKLAEGN